ncbi:MAG TPA: hypothetical protein DCG57_18130 [Candidatus Riflebacteria bacterium]|nr:hypothetical protein [Candidatus Riflebacteria bacterium]
MISQDKDKKMLSRSMIRLYLMVTVLLIPVLAFYFGLKYFTAESRSLTLKNAAQQLSALASSLRHHANENQFWIDRLTVIFSETSSADEFASAFHKLTNGLSIAADLIIYDNAGGVKLESFKNAVNKQEWRDAGIPILQVIKNRGLISRFHDARKLAKTFGPDFYIPVHPQQYFNLSTSLYLSDLFLKDFLYWMAYASNRTILIRFPANELKKSAGLRSFTETARNQGIRLALFEKDALYKSEFDTSDARTAFSMLKTGIDRQNVELNNRLITRVQIGGNRFALLSIDLPKRNLHPEHTTILLIMIFTVILISMLRSGYSPQRMEDFPIILQLAILLGISAGIPMAILGIVGVSHFKNKQAYLINEKHHQMVDFVEKINLRLPNEYSRIARRIKQAIEANSKLLGEDLFSEALGDNIAESLSHSFNGSYLIKENDLRILDGNQRKPQKGDNRSAELNKAQKSDKSLLQLIGQYYLASLNNTAKPVALEKAYMVEMFFQKSVELVIQDLMFNDGEMTIKGWGSNQLLFFIEAFKVQSDKLYDLVAIFLCHPEVVQQRFIRDRIHAILRNPYGFKVYAASNRQFLNENRSLLNYPGINELFTKVSGNRQTEPQIIRFEGEDYLFLAQKGSLAKAIDFCVLYPLQNIRDAISDEAGDLFYLALTAAAIMLFMMTTLYLNLIMPLNQLHLAAKAIENRDADFRLATTRRDEFGEMAEIFNQSIAELEELKIASMVQTRLLPTQPLAIEGFSIFGKSVPMADLGGDYYDYFRVDDKRFVMMLGDVAGHGVGAALIMAIAKAGIICADNYAGNPAEMLSKLHQIILATKSKTQRKVMTFQYLVVDHTSNQLTYSNAGGCSPVLVDANNNSIREISHKGAVLGGFKKNILTNLDLTIEPGQALIFYTDGMVESRNPSGQELGYSGLYQLFLANYDNDAAIYYEKIQSAYRTWLGGLAPGDDLTILILACNRKPGVSEQ